MNKTISYYCFKSNDNVLAKFINFEQISYLRAIFHLKRRKLPTGFTANFSAQFRCSSLNIIQVKLN